jgi:hypothetical protein
VNRPPIWADGERRGLRRTGSAAYDAFWKGYDNANITVSRFYTPGSLTSAAFQAGRAFSKPFQSAIEEELIRKQAKVRNNCKTRGIPNYMVPAVLAYLTEGQIPGNFLTAVLENDLTKAAFHADDRNITCLLEWARTVYNDLPMEAWKSPAKVRAWAKGRGLRGLYERQLFEQFLDTQEKLKGEASDKPE